MAGGAEPATAADSLAARALALEAASDRHPSEVEAAAADLLAESQQAGDAAAASIAARVLGVARRERGDLAGAADALAVALQCALDAGDAALAGRARISVVGLHIVAGDLGAAHAEAARAVPLLAPLDVARLDMQLGVAEEREGSLAAAVARYDAAAPVLAAARDHLWSARLRLNRSVAVAQLGRLAEAARDLDAGAEYFAEADNAVAATIALNRAWLAALGAEVPEALRRYDVAAAVADRVRLGAGLVERDRAELLCQVGLWDDAVVAAERAVAELAGTNPLDAAEARLVLAAALTGARRFGAAGTAADGAEREFLDQNRAAWAARAVVARVTAALGPPTAESAGGARAADALAAARVLAGAGFEADAAEARALAVRAAVARGAEAPAAALPLVPVSGPPWTRARVWQAEAERRLASGDGRGATRAVAAGLEAIAPLRRTLGSLELRAGVGATVEALADLGVVLAAERGPRPLLDWAERRSAGVGVRPAPAGPELGVALAALRAAASDPAGDDGPRAAVIAGRVRAAEAEVRRLDRHARSVADDGVRRASAGFDALRGRTLLRYAVAGGDVWVVSVSGRRARRHRLGAVHDIAASVDRLRFALRRFASGGPGASRAEGAVHAAAGDLAALLVPVERLGGDGEVVVVPDGPLHGVAWPCLAPLAERPIVVAPSLAAWVAAGERAGAVAPRGGEPALFVAGPGLAAAGDEVTAAARAWGAGAQVLDAPLAQTAAVLGGLARVRVAHLACHGHFRGDSPLFSSLALADGPLTVHDILGLEHVPEVVVLGACDVGESVAVAGAEVLGLAAGCLTAGAASVVASVLPLPDGAAAPVLADLVGRLARGTRPAAALAAAATAARESADPTTYAVAASLCCFGAG